MNDELKDPKEEARNKWERHHPSAFTKSGKFRKVNSKKARRVKNAKERGALYDSLSNEQKTAHKSANKVEYDLDHPRPVHYVVDSEVQDE
jgi:hypothetical protein